MIYAFVFPLVGGTLPFLVFAFTPASIYPGTLPQNMQHSAIATFTLGSLAKGVLDIYGTSSDFIKFYWMAGGILTAAGIILYVFQLVFKKKPNTERSA